MPRHSNHISSCLPLVLKVDWKYISCNLMAHGKVLMVLFILKTNEFGCRMCPESYEKKMSPKVLILKSKMICICRIFSSSYHLEHFPEAFIWDKQREGNTSYRASYRGWVKIYHITSVSRKARNPTTLKRFFSFTLKGRSPEKKNAFFWILSKWGGGLAQFFGHLFTCGGQ